MVEGLPLLKNEHMACEGCALGKQHRKEFPSHTNKRKGNILERVHTDVWGPMQTRSVGRAYYFLFFINDRTKYTWAYRMRKKVMVLSILNSLKTLMKSK